MQQQLKDILTHYLDVLDADISLKSNLKDDLGADSLSLFEVAWAIEREYHCDIASDEIESWETVADINNYINSL